MTTKGKDETKAPAAKTRVIEYRWQFMPPTFTGWPDRRPWTKVTPGGVTTGPLPEVPDGGTYTMIQPHIDRIAAHLEDMARTFETQGNLEEAAWHRARTRTAERTMLVRVKIEPPGAPLCEGVPLTPTESSS